MARREIGRLGWVKHKPAACDLPNGPVVSRPRRHAEHYVYTVAHDRVRMDADHKNLAQLVDTGFDNWLAVLERFAGIAVDPAKPSAPHAARDAVISASLARFEEVAARIGHGGNGGLEQAAAL